MLIKHQLVHCRFSTRPVELDLRRRYHDFPSADAPPLRFYPAVFVILLSGSRVEPFVQVDKLWPSLIFEDDAQAGCQSRAETARARTRSLNSQLARTERPVPPPSQAVHHRRLSGGVRLPQYCGGHERLLGRRPAPRAASGHDRAAPAPDHRLPGSPCPRPVNPAFASSPQSREPSSASPFLARSSLRVDATADLLDATEYPPHKASTPRSPLRAHSMSSRGMSPSVFPSRRAARYILLSRRSSRRCQRRRHCRPADSCACPSIDENLV